MSRDQGVRRTTTRRRRADAERNVQTILDAATDGILTGGEVNMAAVARAAGVSRVTLYTHFPTREALVEAAVDRAIADADGLVREVKLDQDPAGEVLSRLLRSHWQTLNRYRHLYAAAAATLPPSRLRTLHAPLVDRLMVLVARGQADGEFRTDLPREWLVAAIFGLMHQAAEEVTAGRMPTARAGEALTATVLSALSG